MMVSSFEGEEPVLRKKISDGRRYADRIRDIYERSVVTLPGISPEEFSSRVEWRMYTERCMNKKNSQHQHHVNGHLALGEYVEKETHYRMVDEGFRWDEYAGRFAGNSDVASAYGRILDSVLAALTAHAIAFSRKCQEYRWPTDDSNLRVPLEPWVSRASECM